MANKLILVPEQLYRGLTSNSPADLNLDFARQNLEKIKHSRKNLSTKNANYNQELRRYLHLRNEHENKPVKVEVVNGSKLLINRKTRQGIRAPVQSLTLLMTIATPLISHQIIPVVVPILLMDEMKKVTFHSKSMKH
jgi:hypothetical protein